MRNDNELRNLIAVLLEERILLRELRMIRVHLRHQDQLLHRILNIEGAIIMDLSALETEVAENTDVVGSVETLISRLVAELEAANSAGDTEKVAALTAQLDANTARLAEAVAANTEAPPA